MKFLIRFFGLKGSWSWAIRQMAKGKVIMNSEDTGSRRYRFSVDDQQRLQWCFNRSMINPVWENANIFMDDYYDTNWKVFEVKK